MGLNDHAVKSASASVRTARSIGAHPRPTLVWAFALALVTSFLTATVAGASQPERAWQDRTESVCHSLRQAGLRQAQRRGLRGDDAADCAMEFVAAMLGRDHCAPGFLDAQARQPHYERWLNRCATNHALNFCRDRNGERQPCVPLPTGSAEADEAGRELSDRSSASSPEFCLLLVLLRQQLAEVLAGLKPVQRDLFVQHYVRGETVRDLAGRYAKSENAVRLDLTRARKHLQAQLADQGFSEADLRETLEQPCLAGLQQPMCSAALACAPYQA